MKYKLLLSVFLLVIILPSCRGTDHIDRDQAGLTDPHSCRIAGRDAICGYIPVYENHTAQHGRIIRLNIAILKADSSNPASDPVFFLAGGPGEAATESTGNIEFIDWIVDGHRDIVLVDQRGTGGSNNVIVPPSPDFSGSSPDEMESKLKTWIDQMLPELDMNPRYYTTSVAMDDLDVVRLALGYDEINLFGTSYGTTAAQYYLRQYEGNVRTVTLLAGSLLDVPVFELEPDNAQRALDLVFDRCEADSACQSAFPNVRREIAELLERLEQDPVEVKLENGTVGLTRDYFAAKVEWLMRDGSRIRSLPLWIHQAYEENDWSVFAEAGVNGFGSQVMTYIIRCSEKWATFTPQGLSRQSPNSFLLNWSMSEAMRIAPVCKYIPRGETPEGSSDQVPSQKPVLLFNGEWDVLDPPGNIAGAQELWPNSLALTIPWQSHEISDTSVVSCMRGIIRDFIDHASTNNLNVSCLQTLEPPVFRTGQ